MTPWPRCGSISLSIDGFFDRHLTAEYRQLILAAVCALARKRPSPLLGQLLHDRKVKQIPQPQGHQSHRRNLPPGGQVVGPACDQDEPCGEVPRRSFQPDRYSIAVTAEDGGMDVELIEQPR